jgi:hypothetical protein
MKDHSLLKRSRVEPNVFESKRSEVDRSGVDVTQSHREGIENIVKYSSRIEPEIISITAACPVPTDLLLLDVNSVGTHERQLESNRLQMQRFEEDIGLPDGDVGFLDILGVFNEHTVGSVLHSQMSDCQLTLRELLAKRHP